MAEKDSKDPSPEVDEDFQSSLCKNGRSSLYEEREAIASKRGQLANETKEMAFLHYPTFISGKLYFRKIRIFL